MTIDTDVRFKVMKIKLAVDFESHIFINFINILIMITVYNFSF